MVDKLIYIPNDDKQTLKQLLEKFGYFYIVLNQPIYVKSVVLRNAFLNLQMYKLTNGISYNDVQALVVEYLHCK